MSKEKSRVTIVNIVHGLDRPSTRLVTVTLSVHSYPDIISDLHFTYNLLIRVLCVVITCKSFRPSVNTFYLKFSFPQTRITNSSLNIVPLDTEKDKNDLVTLLSITFS